jgi:hypothetical protein
MHFRHILQAANNCRANQRSTEQLPIEPPMTSVIAERSTNEISEAFNHRAT